MDEDEIQTTTSDAIALIETHPVDQIIILIRHFGKRIRNLSELKNSWNYFQEIFETENFQIDLQEEKLDQYKQDTELRENATEFLKESYEDLTQEERTVLEIFIKHNHPRTQLFWANQARGRYPNLSSFFEENDHLMLSGGPTLSKG